MKILLIDTTGQPARVVLAEAGTVVAKKEEEIREELGIWLLGAIQELLDEVEWKKKEIKRVAVCAGPGHYSALRTGIVTATILAQGLGRELVSVSADKIKEQLKEAEEARALAGVEPIYNNRV
jgi:tRNA threonylcarbamoyladenosine biosynthesis protein TsaB